MTSEQRKKLDEAKRLLAELEQEMGKSVEEALAAVCRQYGGLCVRAEREEGQDDADS